MTTTMSRMTEAANVRKLKTMNKGLYKELGKLVEEREYLTTTHNLFVEYLEETMGNDWLMEIKSGFERWLQETPTTSEGDTNGGDEERAGSSNGSIDEERAEGTNDTAERPTDGEL